MDVTLYAAAAEQRDVPVYRLFIGGEWVDAASGKFFDVENPATGEVAARVAEAEAEDVDRAVQAAARAFREGPWPRMHGSQRARILYRFADLLEEQLPRLAELETIFNGRPIREMRAQLSLLPGWYRYFAGMADKVQGDTIPVEGPYLNYTIRVALGVVAQVTPWNHPLLISTKKLAPALAAGNTVVLKPSEMTPVTLLELAALFQKAGLPDGVLNVIAGFGPTCGAPLAAHPLVRKIDLTGGTPTGKAVARIAADNLTPTTFELGGKAPVIVFEDADFEQAVNGAVFALFVAAGETCVAGARALVQRPLYDRFIQAVKEKVSRLKVGNPLDPTTDIGALISGPHRDRVEKFVQSALDEGARLVCGGRRPDDPALAKGYFYLPTVFADVRPDMTIAQEEIFGPVLAIMPFDTEEEAISIANGIRYGLGASVWTKDVRKAHRVAHAIEAGIVWINDHHRIAPASPWGGFKESGYGRENGFYAMAEYTEVKSVWVKLSDEPFDWFDRSGGEKRLN